MRAGGRARRRAPLNRLLVSQDRRFKNRELEIMETLRHPNVVKLKYSFFTTDSNEVIACAFGAKGV